MLSNTNSHNGFVHRTWEFVDTGERFSGKPDSIHLGAGIVTRWTTDGKIADPVSDIEKFYKDGREIRKV